MPLFLFVFWTLFSNAELELPEVLYDINGFELWMSTSFLEDGDGVSLNKKSGLSSKSRLTFEHYLATLAKAPQTKDNEDCPIITVTNSGFFDGRPFSSFTDLVKQSRAIFLAEIGNQTPGFFNQAPSLALELRITRMLKGDMTEKRVFLPYPNVRLKVAGTPFCIYTREHAVEPQSHGKVLVFMYRAPIKDKVTFLQEDPKMLFFSVNETGLSIPNHLKQDPDLSNVLNFNNLLDLTLSKIKVGRIGRQGEKPK